MSIDFSSKEDMDRLDSVKINAGCGSMNLHWGELSRVKSNGVAVVAVNNSFQGFGKEKEDKDFLKDRRIFSFKILALDKH